MKPQPTQATMTDSHEGQLRQLWQPEQKNPAATFRSKQSSKNPNERLAVLAKFT
jgi:hypothetical protein